VTPPGFALDHVAVGVARIADAAPFVAGVLGGREHGGGPSPGFRFFQWSFADGGRLEVLEPSGPPDGFLHRFLERRGPGVHHVTFKVPSLAAAAERARDAGYDVVGWSDDDPYWKECFLHPKQAQGVVVQLAEEHPRPPGRDPDSWPKIELPPPPADAPPPVRLLALRLAARDADAARRQWGALLGGEARELAGGVVGFRYPRSPVGIVVETRPDAGEGPLAIEIACDRAWPEGGHEALGTRFVRAGPPAA
jgi:catechol 2,3-dioxygenase-like lactoylglutathione lyase family enzyme